MKTITKICVSVTIMLVVLKLFGFVVADWWIMFFPMYVMVAFNVFVFMVVGILFWLFPELMHDKYLERIKKEGFKKNDNNKV